MEPGCPGSIFPDGEAGPSNNFARRKVLNFNGGGDNANETDGVAKLFMPRNLRGLRVGRPNLIVMVIAIGLLFEIFH